MMVIIPAIYREHVKLDTMSHQEISVALSGETTNIYKVIVHILCISFELYSDQ